MSMGFHVFRAMMLSTAMLGMPGPIASESESEKVVTGIGLVIGLSGTGDASVDPMVVESSIVGLLRRAGLDPWQEQINPGQVAKVLVTAEMPPDLKDGQRVAVSVTAIGDATSLTGGTLLVTPLRGQDGRVYVVGQGRVEIGNQVAGADPAVPSDRAVRVGSVAGIAVLAGDHFRETAFD